MMRAGTTPAALASRLIRFTASASEENSTNTECGTRRRMFTCKRSDEREGRYASVYGASHPNHAPTHSTLWGPPWPHG